MTRGQNVLDILTGRNTLLDSKLIAISVAQDVNGNASVELNFRGRAGSDFSEVEVQFSEIIECEITYECTDGFIDIWDYKFIKLADDSFYISLDPDPSTLGAAGVLVIQPSETDHFFVHARHIVATLTPIDCGPTRPQDPTC